jgi:hypothetical protein
VYRGEPGDEICGEIQVDVNGYQAPNQFGVDLFHFYYAKNAIIPMGMPKERYYAANSANCLNKLYGHGCAAWVLLNENMDYLHCTGLNWDTKTKCK